MFESEFRSNTPHFIREVYREQLVTFVETGLNKNLVSKLSPTICGRVEAMQIDIVSRLMEFLRNICIHE